MATRISSALEDKKLIQSAQIDWAINDNFVLLSPFLSNQELNVLAQLAIKVSNGCQLQSHIWFATSGSTAENQSRVKLVALSQRALVNSAISVNQWIQATEQDCWLQALPFFHVGGVGIELRARLSGAKIVFSEIEKWNPHFFVNECQNYQVTITSLVPTQVFDLVEQNIQSPKYLRVVFVGGGQLKSDLYLRARKLGWPLLPSYGMTETGSMIACANLKSLSEAKNNPEIKILPHAKVKTNEEDHLIIESSSLLTMYARNLNDDGTEYEYFDPKIKGIFVSEDCGQVTDGGLIINGRKSDFIKIGGEASHLGRLREILNQLVKSDEVNLVAVPDLRLDQKLVLVFTSQMSNLITELIEQYNEKVMPYEKIRQSIEVKEIPRSPLGKILFEKLKLNVQAILNEKQSGS